MNLTTIFDVASLTKVVVTTPLVLQFVEEGRVRLDDPLARYLPEFRGHPAGRATVRQLLLHTSGLPPGLPRGDTSEGRAAILRAIRGERLLSAPGTRYLYSDLDYILLGILLSGSGAAPCRSWRRSGSSSASACGRPSSTPRRRGAPGSRRPRS